MRDSVRRIVFWAAIVIALGCFGFAAWYHYSNYRAARIYEQTRSEMEEAAKATEAATDKGAETETAVKSVTLEEILAAEFTGEIDGEAPKIPEDVLTEVREHPVDFDVLHSYNPELYAWIRVPGSNIDYPVAQHEGEDQGFYLHHDLYGTPQFAGCIYSEAPSAKDFSDPVTVLYGHNMKNGSMFQNLHRFRERDFFEAHPYVYIYTPEDTLVYRILSVYAYDSRDIMESFDFTDTEELERYLDSAANPRSMEANVRRELTVTKDDHILTLSTCITGDTGSRLLLQAVLTYETDPEL